jgi:hypothetical protein
MVFAPKTARQERLAARKHDFNSRKRKITGNGAKIQG